MIIRAETTRLDWILFLMLLSKRRIVWMWAEENQYQSFLVVMPFFIRVKLWNGAMRMKRGYGSYRPKTVNIMTLNNVFYIIFIYDLRLAKIILCAPYNYHSNFPICLSQVFIISDEHSISQLFYLLALSMPITWYGSSANICYTSGKCWEFDSLTLSVIKHFDVWLLWILQISKDIAFTILPF